ncbi:MAG: aminotransferase class III-fold pyridoxal phosphate-dependent enzyme, partial [Caldilineae bacterium]
MPGVRFAEFNNIDSLAEQMDEHVCAVIVEPVQGEGGIHPASNEFMVALRELSQKHNALLILDEVQCGVGRTGTFWAHEQYGILPDILCAAKPLANGLPIGAVLVTERVAEVIQPGDHGTTFAGGPFVTAVANVVVRRISDPDFLAHVRETGAYFKERLEEINSPHIQEVRGRGLMLGVQLDIEALPIIRKGYEHGILLLNAGPNVLRLIPPLIISRAEVDLAVERIAAILSEMD